MMIISDHKSASATTQTQGRRHKQQRAQSIRLIEPELPYLRRYARSLTRDIDQADDLVHDCVARAIVNIDKWEPGTQMRPWLIVMTRNLFYNRCRRLRREREAMAEIGISGDHSTAPAQETSLDFNDVAEAFAQLSDDHREVLALVVIEGMDYEAAASIMGVRVGTVKSRLSRARQVLREKVDHA